MVVKLTTSKEICNSLTSLTVLSFKDNSLDGSLPFLLSRLVSIRVLDLSFNRLISELPVDFKNLTNLQVVNLEGNQFGPSFPVLHNRLIALVLRGNRFRNGIQGFDLGSFYQLGKLDLSSNEFNGPFLDVLFSLPSTMYLNVSGNKFSRRLSVNISCSDALVFVDLSFNRFTGELPSCMQTAKSRDYDSVLYGGNCLSNVNQKQQHNVSFCHNEALAVMINLPDVSRNDSLKSSSKVKVVVATSVVGGVVVGGVAVVGVVLVAIRSEVFGGGCTAATPQIRVLLEKVSPAYTMKMLKDARMDVTKVNSKLLGELEEMGFPLARAMRALLYSGNSSLEDAISYIVEHEDGPEIDQMSSVPVIIEIEDSKSSSMSEEVKLKAQKLRVQKSNKEEDKEFEQRREKERIRVGKELQEAKKIAEENERRRFIALRKAEKEDEKRARQRVRQKLQQDKIERRGKVGLPPENHASYKTVTTMVQENKKEILPLVSNGIQVTSTTKVDLMRNCLRSLRQNNKDDDIKVKRAFETLLVYIGNIARDPEEDKFRKIRMSNQAFKERVGIFEQGVKFLELCGFEQVEGGRYLVLPRERFDMAEFKAAGNLLQSAITNPFFGLLSTEE